MNYSPILLKTLMVLTCLGLIASPAPVPALASPWAAAALADAERVLSVLPASAMPGQRVRVIASGLAPGEKAALYVGREGAPAEIAGAFAADEMGRLQIDAILPLAAKARQVWVVELRLSTGIILSNRLTVTSRPTLYAVRAGETMERIARGLGVRPSALARANPELASGELLTAGQTLIIPDLRRDYRPGSLAPAPFMKQAVLLGSAPADPQAHWVDVDLTLQRAYAYEGETLVRAFTVSTGVRRHPTLTGDYKVYRRHEKTTMSGEGYYLRNVPFTLYYDRGYALHGTYWHHNFGTPMSHGCVNFSVEDSAWLFGFAPIGTLVNIHY